MAGDGGHMASACDSRHAEAYAPSDSLRGVKAGEDCRDSGYSRCRTDHGSKSKGRNTQGSGAARPRVAYRDEDRRAEP